MSEGRRFDAWLFLGAFGLRLLWILDLSRLPFFDLPTSDSLFYARQAALIAGGQFIGTELSYPSSPLYPYLVAPFFLLSGRALWWCLYLAQAALDAGSAVLLRRTGSALFAPLAGRIAGIAWAGYGLAVFFTGDLMEITVAAFFANLFMYLMVRGSSHSAIRPARLFALAGLALGLACLLRPHFLPLAVVSLGAMPILAGRTIRKGAHPPVAPPIPAEPRSPAPTSKSWAGFRALLPAAMTPQLQSRATWVRAAAVFAAGLALPLSLSLARNYAASGEVVLVSPYSGLNAYLGNHREASGTLRFPTGKGLRNDVDLRRAAHVYPESIEGRPMSEREISSFWWKETRAEISAAPSSWAGLMLAKLRLFWSSREAPNHLDFYFFQSASLPLAMAVVPFGLLGPLALAGGLLIVGCTLAGRISRFRDTSSVQGTSSLRIRPDSTERVEAEPGASATIPATEAAAALPEMVTALTMPGPLFLAIATLSYAVVASAFFIGDRFRLPATGWITLMAAGSVARIVVSLRGGFRREAAAFVVAVALLAVALHEPVAGPRGAREYVLVAAALEGRGRFVEAERLLRRAVVLEPDNAVARYNLGRHLARTGSRAEASVEAGQAARLAPGFAPAQALLGDLSLLLDPTAPGEARRRYEEALRIEPYGADADRLRATLATLEAASSR